MADLKQVLTYAQTFELTFDNDGNVPVTVPPTTYPGSVEEVSNSYAAEINGTELVRGSVACTGLADDLVLCDVETATQCFAYIKADALNTDSITISYVDETPTTTAIAVLAPGQSLYIPFLVSITPLSGDNCKLVGLATSGTQRVYVSASHNG